MSLPSRTVSQVGLGLGCRHLPRQVLSQLWSLACPGIPRGPPTVRWMGGPFWSGNWHLVCPPLPEKEQWFLRVPLTSGF